MRTVTYKVDDLKKVAIHIGRAEENEATRVQIDAGSVFAEYPAAVPAMKVISPAGVTYSREVTRDGNLVVWDVVDSDLAAEGYGEMQLTFTENSVKVKSAIAQIRVCRSISGGTTPPDPVQDWIDRAEEVLEEVEDAFPEGGTTGQVLAKKSNDDYDTEWVDQGAGGVSDYDDLENRPQIGGVTLTGDKSLHDLGAASASEVSAKYTKPSGGIPATDIADGVIPDPTSIIDDTAGDGDTNKVWSADKVNELKSELNNAVYWEENQEEPDSIEGIIESEIKENMTFAVVGTTLYLKYKGDTVTSVELPTAEPVPCTGISLDLSVASVEAGKTVTLTATVSPSNTTDSVTWGSSSDSVATVENGVVTGVGKGTATITVTCGSYSDTCTVTVSAYYKTPLLGYVFPQNNRLDYASAYSYKNRGTFNDPFLRKVSNGQTVSLEFDGTVQGLYVNMYVYDTGTFTDKCTADGSDYVLTQTMIDMQSSSTYGILVSSTQLHSYGAYALHWAGDYTATQDCYVAFAFNIDGSSDISSDLTAIKNSLTIEVA